jgi:hypothetical protein
MTFDEKVERWAEHHRRAQAEALPHCRHVSMVTAAKITWPDCPQQLVYRCMICGTYLPTLPEVRTHAA